MSTRSKRRRSTGRTYETEPNTKQVHFPAPVRSIKDRHPSWTSPRRYQQTITQMNPFHAIFHPESESKDLEYEEEEPEDSVALPVPKKRRRFSPEKPVSRRIETRSSASKGVKSSSRLIKDDKPPEPSQENGETGETGPSPSKFETQLMPPLQTPRSTRKREIPSSQSPAESPLSAQSRTPVRVDARSPLKERSTNPITPSLRSAVKAPCWLKKMEVADSMESNETDTRSPRNKSEKLDKGIETCTPRAIRFEPQPQCFRRESSPKEVPESSQSSNIRNHNSAPSNAYATLHSNTEFAIEMEEEDQGRVSGDCTESLQVQAPVSPSKSRPHDSFKSIQFDPLGSPPRSIHRTKAVTPGKIHSLSILQEPSSQADSASAQILNDLHRSTLPTLGVLQTESQYENAWMPYHPASTPDENFPSPIEEVPSSITGETSAQIEEVPSSMPDANSLPPPKQEFSSPLRPQTVSTQLIPHPHHSSTSQSHSSSHAPIPPSQATTTDITQTQHLYVRKMPSSSSLILPSSPPPMPPPSSSPSRVADLWKDWKWNGIRLTDSQLLPESLLNDSVGMPPLRLDLSDEELEEG